MAKPKNKDVLLIEPDKLLAGTYKRALKKRGISYVWNPSAGEALTDIDLHQPKLIILELQLQGNNGIEFLHELRSYPDWEHIPVLILSVVPESEANISHQLGQQLRIVDYCYKPRTSLEHLLTVVQGQLKS